MLHCASAVGNESIQNSVQALLVSSVKLSFFSNLVQKGSVTCSQVGNELRFKFGDLRGHHFVQVPSDTSENNADLLLCYHRHLYSIKYYKLLLFQEFSELSTSIQELLSGSIEIRSELGEGSDFSVLGKLEF